MTKNLWDKEALFGKKEEIRGKYLSGLFHKAIDKGLELLPKPEKTPIKLLKTDLWNEGVDYQKDVLGYIKDNNFIKFGTDISWEVLTSVKDKNILRTQSSIKALPYLSNSLDILFDFSTLDHVPHDQSKQVLTEYYRTLKPNGVIVIAIDAWGSLWKMYFWYLKNIRKMKVSVFSESNIQNQFIYKPKNILKDLMGAGFKIKKEYSIDCFGWSWNRLTKPLWNKLFTPNPDWLINFEFSGISKHLKIFAKQYVIVAQK